MYLQSFFFFSFFQENDYLIEVDNTKYLYIFKFYIQG
jgi:hypothetical protein